VANAIEAGSFPPSFALLKIPIYTFLHSISQRGYETSITMNLMDPDIIEIEICKSFLPKDQKFANPLYHATSGEAHHLNSKEDII
jgi:hypothetical protein